ncbi:MAG: hypothetical protein RLZZ385_2546 [Pseudomonadota bacterium]|jgi:uncharacterized repeat protein (TIGR01451 family)
MKINSQKHGSKHRVVFGLCALVLLCLLNFAAAPAAEAACGVTYTPTGNAVEFVSCTETQSGDANVTSLTIPTPSGVALNDYLIAVIVVDNNETFLPTSGWALETSFNNGNNVDMAIYTRVGTGAEAADYTFSWGSNEEAYGYIMHFKGTSGIAQIATNTGFGTAAQTPSVTTTSANNLILRIGGFDDDDINVNPGTIMTGHTGITQNYSSNTAGNISGGAAFRYRAVAGADGTANFVNFTGGQSEEWATTTISLPPGTPPFLCPGVDNSVVGSQLVVLNACTETKVIGSTTINLLVPGTAAVGDLLVAVIQTDDNQNFNSIPAGWDTVSTGDAGGAGPTLGIFKKFAEQADLGGSFNFGIDGSEGIYGYMLNFRGASGYVTAPNPAVQNGNSNAPTAPSLTTAVNNTLVLRVAGSDADQAVQDPPVIVSGQRNITQDTSETGDDGNAVTGQAVYLNRPTAGASGTGDPATVAFSLTTADTWRAATFGIEPVEFRFSMPDTTAATCGSQMVTLSITDRAGNPMTWFTGTVTLTASNSTGASWANPNAIGTLTDNGNGNATFQFVAGNGGTVTLQYHNPTATTVNFGVSYQFGAGYNTYTESGSFDPTLTVNNNCSFRIIHDTQAGTCGPEPITVRVWNNVDNALATHYAGAINITAATVPGPGNNGNYTLNTGTPANFSDPTPNDGSALYDFSLGENEIILNYTNTTAETVNFNVVDTTGYPYTVDGGFDPNLVVGNCALRFSHDGTSDVCSVHTVTLSVVDGGGATITNYTGTVSLSSSSGSGTWSNIDGSGTFTPGGGGTATYTFLAGDGGDVQLGYRLAVATTVNFNATAAGLASPAPPYDADLVISNCSARISVAGTANICSASGVPLTLGIYNSAGVLATDYTGTIVLNTSTAHGNYISTSGPGILNNGVSGDGIATYQFVAGDNGDTVINFTNTFAETLDFSASSTYISFDAGNSTETLQMLACEFRISHSSSSDVCSVEVVTVSVYNSANNPVTNYTGTVNLSTSTNHGTWTLNTGGGSVVDPVAGDGSATYNFVVGDAGVVQLNFTDSFQEIVNINVSDGVTTDPGNSADPDDQNITIANCSFRIALADGTMSACESELVTITVYNSLNAIATGYTGTVSLSTSTLNGNWALQTGSGIVTDTPGDDNGYATYAYDASDNGVVVLRFTDPNFETVNINLSAGTIAEDGAYDPNLSVTGCTPVASNFVCQNVGQSANLTIGAQNSIPALRGRMVVMFVFHVGTEDVANSPTFNGQAMTLIHKEQNSAGAGTSVELWGILDTNLPSSAGSYSGAYSFVSAPANSPSMCMVELTDVEQSFPVYNAGTPNAGAVNGSQATSPANGNLATTITTQANNAVVLSGGVTDYVGGANSWFNDVTPNPPMSLLLGAGNNDARPQNGTAGGSSGVKPVAGIFTVTDIDNQTPANGYAHIVASFDPLVAGLPEVTGYVPVLLFETYSGNISYRAIGHSLRNLSNDDGGACSFVPFATGTSATLNMPSVPNASTVLAAYLYWAGSGETADIDDTVSFGPTGSEIAVTADDVFQIEGVGGTNNLDYFAAYKDVTSLVTGNGSYTVKDLTVQTGAPWSGGVACGGGWSLIVIYENINERLRVANMFHGFQPFQNSAFTLVPRNFRMATTDGAYLPNGQVTHVTLEGDEDLFNGDESLGLQTAPNAETFNTLSTGFNPPNAEFNSTVTRPIYIYNGGTTYYEWNSTGGPLADGYEIDGVYPQTGPNEVGDSWGFDIDTHYITGATGSDYLFPFAQLGKEAEQINTRYSSGQDLVMLISEVISITNYPIADLEIFKSQSGSFKVNGTGAYHIEVTNNGNGAVSGGYADGEVIVGDVLPAGMTLASVSGDGWDCSLTTATAFTCIFDIATDWTLARGATTLGELAKDETLPQITANINVGSAASFPLLSNNVKNVARMVHVGGSCGALTAGVVPPESYCDRAPQFDNRANLEGGSIDINDLDDKETNNNNLDSIITEVRGVETDLGITKSLNGILEVGETGSYTLTVTNYGPDPTTATITVADSQPAGITFTSAAGTGWTCPGSLPPCTYAASLGVGSSATITLSVNVTGSAGQNVTNTAQVTAGTFNFDTNAGNNSATTISTIVAPPVSSEEKFLLSVSVPGNSTQIGGLAAFENHDYIVYDPLIDTGTMFFDNSALGFSVDDADAVHLYKNGKIAISADGSSTVGSNTLAFEPEDIVVYDPIIGTAAMLFDGSAIFTGPITSNQNIDAVYVRENGNIVFSTEGPATIGATSFQRGDLVEYNPGTGIATIILDASDADVFGSEVQVDGVYIRVDPADPDANIDVFVLSVGDASATIGACGSCDPAVGTILTWDDIVEYDNTGAFPVTENLFLGDVPLGVFTPADANRRIDAIHVAEDGYLGHFAIAQSQAGSTCVAGQITISKHRGLTHALDTDYSGSIRISTSTNQGDWSIAVGNGTLDNGAADDGIAVYTFVPSDGGDVTLYLAETSPSTINVNVTNGYTRELGSEDPSFTFNNEVTVVSYEDYFEDPPAFSNNNGSTLWNGDWVEVDDGGAGPSTGNLTISGGVARFTTLPGQPNTSLARKADLSLYTIDADVTLDFDYSYQSLNAGSDVFVVEARKNSGDGFTQVWSFNSGGTNLSPQGVSLNLTSLLPPGAFTSTTEVRFRVSAGYTGTSNMRIDNVNLSTSTNDCGIGTIDHYEIRIDGITGPAGTLVDGIACVGSTITITGHDANHFPASSDEIITLQTSTGKGSWVALLAGSGVLTDSNLTDGTATYDFPPNQSLVSFRFNYTNPVTDPENVNFNLGTAFSVNVNEDPTLRVNQAGLRFFDETNQTDVNPIPTQIAGKPSNVAPLNRILTIEAVRTSDDDPQACLPLFNPGNVLTIGFAAECVDPGVCSSGPAPAVSINSQPISLVNDNSGSGASAYTDLNLTFATQPNSGNPAAQLVYQYADAGQMQLHARFNIPLNNSPVGTTVGDYLYGSSNAFISRPFGFDVDFSGDRSTNGTGGTSYAANASGTVFATAGVAFDTTVSAIVWESADDANNDGIPDQGATLYDNAVTRNYGNESTASQYDVRITLNQIVAPSSGVGFLSDNLFPVFTNGQQTKTMTFSEVGIIDLDAQLVDEQDGTSPFTFMGTQTLTGNVKNVGRFIPAKYEISGGVITSRPLAVAETGSLANSTFTYMGEEFEFSTVVTAYNGAVTPTITRNYVGDFIKLNAAQLGINTFFAIEEQAGPDNSFTPRLAMPNDVSREPDVTWGTDPGSDGGVGTIAGNLILERQASGVEDGPYTLNIGLNTQDTDTVGFTLDLDSDDVGGNDIARIASEEFRYGRLLIDNAFGPETEPLGVPFRIEYWNGTEFVLNTDDSSTTLVFDTAGPALSFVAGSYLDQLADGETILEDGETGTVEISFFEGQTAFKASGADLDKDRPFLASAPGEDNEGSVIVELDLDHISLPFSMDFLSYDWRTPAGDVQDDIPDADYTDNPRGRLEFGQYRGHDRIINWQEIYIGN